ncbi:MAG: DUF998 domain-containing protein [Candidatus Saccharimonadales bacterium]
MDKSNKFWNITYALSILAAIFYASWPLGYILNPSASKHGLASALEALHQPYNWLFILLDVLCSAFVLVVALSIWGRYKNNIETSLKYVLVLMGVFAVGTLVDTLLPERCLPGSSSCPSWKVDHILLLHGIFSILAAIGLFISLLIIWKKRRTNILSALLIGYIVFGLISFYEALYPSAGNYSQHYYITLCGLWIALLPFSIRKTYIDNENNEQGPRFPKNTNNIKSKNV